ncbi:MAG: DUF493 domain-containing protein [Desulfuromonas sp.]|nr:MAG: DUF493 domain-containing protein [Desulfuromonas sp.]
MMSKGDELLDFPCDYMFKAVGPAAIDEQFQQRVIAAVRRVVDVPVDGVKLRESSGKAYLAVTVLVRLVNRDQLERIYAELRGLEGLKFLL